MMLYALTLPVPELFEHKATRPSVQTDPASINAMKQTCALTLLAFYFLPTKLKIKMLFKHQNILFLTLDNIII